MSEVINKCSDKHIISPWVMVNSLKKKQIKGIKSDQNKDGDRNDFWGNKMSKYIITGREWRCVPKEEELKQINHKRVNTWQSCTNYFFINKMEVWNQLFIDNLILTN